MKDDPKKLLAHDRGGEILPEPHDKRRANVFLRTRQLRSHNSSDEAFVSSGSAMLLDTLIRDSHTPIQFSGDNGEVNLPGLERGEAARKTRSS